MKILIIILLFISISCYSQKFRNYYDFRDGSGTTLTDAMGSNNGTLAGTSTAPTWANTNKYVRFTGGNAAAGDRGRINFTQSDYNYTYNAPFTWSVTFRSSKSDALIHWVSGNYDGASALYNINSYLDASEFTNTGGSCASSSQTKIYQGNVNLCDGKWHTITMISSGSNTLTVYVDGQPKTLTTNNNQTSGNFWTAVFKYTLGACWNQVGSNYRWDFTGDICRSYNSAVALTPADIQNQNNEFLIIQ